MKNYSLFFILVFSSSIIAAQRIHVGVFGGASAYNGDLTDKIFPKKLHFKNPLAERRGCSRRNRQDRNSSEAAARGIRLRK